MRHLPMGLFLATLAGLGGCGSSDPRDGTGTVVGRVISPHAGGLDAVAGAVVIHPSGARAVADGDGTFVLEDVPPGEATLRIEGPRLADPDQALSYAPGFASVDVVVDAEVAVEAAILLGCERTFDPAEATTLPLRGCGVDRGTIELPAGAIADDAGGFDGRVRAELAVVDPAGASLQALALPPPPSDTPIVLVGGVAVRLTDADTGAPLQLAAGQVARLRLPIADEAAAAALTMAWRDDDGATAAQPELIATTSVDGSGAYVVLDVSHFSSYMAIGPAPWTRTAELRVRGWIGSANQCSAGCVVSSTSGQDVNPTCAGTVCVNDSTAVEVWWGTQHVHGTAGRPISVPPDTAVSVRLRHANPLTRTLTGASIYDSGWFGVRTPSAGQRLDVGPVAVPAVPEGCTELQLPATWLAPGTGMCEASPMVSRSFGVRILRGGELIQLAYGDFCAAAGACVELPAPGDAGLIVEAADGRRSTLNGNPGFGQTCGGGTCPTVGTTATTPPVIGPWFSYRIVRNLLAAPAAGDPGTEFTIDLDAATSTGPIDTYAWTVFAVEGATEVPIWDAAAADAVSGLSLDAGTYRVRLRGYGGRGQWAETSSAIVLGGDPDAPVASFTVTPANPGPGESFELSAAASTATSPIVSYEWDLDGNGSFEASYYHPFVNYVFAAAGPHPITLRVTDDQLRTGEVTRVVQVGGATGGVTITVLRAGDTAGAYVISSPSGISCTEGTSAVCSATFPVDTNVHLDAYVEGVPAEGAWGTMSGADGHQLYLGNVTVDLTVTATF